MMDDEQLQMEVDWCLARLEEKLAGMDPYSRPAQEAAKVHRILKSTKAPVVKKRQAMRNMFGDYRAKMKAMEKKSVAAMKKSKLVAVKEPPSESKFLRRSTSSQLAQKASSGAVVSAAEKLDQLSVSGAPQSESKAADASENDSAASKSPSIVSSAEGGTAVAGSSSDMAPSEFKFNFDGTECGPDVNDSTSSSRPAALAHNYFVFKPSNEEFRFNFTVDENE